MNIIVKERIRYGDKKSPYSGHVKVEKDKKIEIDKDNTVLTAGREYLYNLFKDKLEGSKVYLTLGTGTGATDSATKSLTNEKDIVVSHDNEIAYPTNTDGELNTDGDLYIKFTKTISSLTATENGGELGVFNLTELGIKVGENIQSSTLLTRVVFDTLPVNENNNYNLEYYLYF